MRVRLALLLGALFLSVTQAVFGSRLVSFIVEGESAPSVEYGLAKLSESLQAQGCKIERVPSVDLARGDLLVVARHISKTSPARDTPAFPAGLESPESLAIQKTTLQGKPALVLTGGDDRGLMYAALDAAERVQWVGTNDDPFREIQEIVEHPLVRERTLSVYTMHRKYWESRFYDQRYWERYFDLLAASRFNRFLIVFGYENGGFLAPPYPYFFATPNFPDVKMVGLTSEQQQANLVALNRLIDIAHRHGIAVSLGIWDHIYRAGVQSGGAEWTSKYAPNAIPNTVQGVTSENLNAYTLASLQELLRQVPGVDGLQFRVHEESGLKREEIDGFWSAVFDHIHRVKPHLSIELRAKGTPDSVLTNAANLGLNVRVETKYWMEQMGLPFHPVHVNPPNQRDRRQGYADLLRYPQKYQIDWRLWNGGTTRVLLWGDPDYVRRYSLSTLLYQSPNWDVQEPLATKMEAQPPDMPPFELMPAKYRYYAYEFERYWAFYRMWGRIGYNPNASPALWQHEFQRRFGAAGTDLAEGLQRASQVLPMIVAAVYPYRLFPTTRGWAERQSLGARLEDYAKNEGSDTALFENFAEAAHRIATSGATTKRTPEETSRWFEATAEAIQQSILKAKSKIGSSSGAEFEATLVDLAVLRQLALFHARRSLAAVHYNLYLETHSATELHSALEAERHAVAEWRTLVEEVGDHYTFDLAMGTRDRDLCGHWRNELSALEADLRQIEMRGAATGPAPANEKVWIPAAETNPSPKIGHEPLRVAYPGVPIKIVAHVSASSGIAAVRVRYRHLTQFEDYASLDLEPAGEPNTYSGTIPGTAVSAEWDFMYYLEATDRSGNGITWPDPMKELPYVVVSVKR